MLPRSTAIEWGWTVCLALLFSCRSNSIVASPDAAAVADASPVAERSIEAELPPLPESVDAEAELPAPRADLDDIRAQGELRVLVVKQPDQSLPLAGSLETVDVGAAVAFAESLGVRLRFVVVPMREALHNALTEGRGDLVVPEPDADRMPGVAVSHAVRQTEPVVVVRSGDRKAPRDIKQLAHHKVYLRPASHFADLLAPARKGARRKYEVVEAPDSLEVDEILHRVGSGEYDTTIAWSDDVQSYLSYRDDVQTAFVVGERRPMAWAVRANATKLLESVNAFFDEWNLTEHLHKAYGGDLEEIKRRKVLRVAMLNNAASYFIYRGQEVGFQYELADLLATRLGVRLEVVVPDRPADLTRLLIENRADLAPITLTDDFERPPELVYSEPISFAAQILVQPAGEAPITSMAGLAGKRIHVRRSSEYFSRLEQLAKQVPGLEVVPASEDLETYELIDLVGKGKIPLTVSNSALLGAELTYRDDVRGTLVLAEKLPLAYAARKTAPKLLARVNEFVKKEVETAGYRALIDKYFHNTRHMAEVQAEQAAVSGKISPYDELAKKYGSQYGIDWRLIIAQMYQESRFDPKAKSWVGATGLMQVMPKTGAGMGVRDLTDPEQNIACGVKYLAQLRDQIDADIPVRQRLRFALAAYNAGLGHVIDARQLARERRLDRDVWFGHVEQAMLLLENPRYYQRTRHGYCRGTEPVQYVSRIQSKYDAYTSVMPEAQSNAADGETLAPLAGAAKGSDAGGVADRP
jgi:membrane-bound lytic murein transglycosylase F